MGLRLAEFDQTGAPPEDADLVWIEAPSNPLLTIPDFEAAAAHPAHRRRRDRGDAGPLRPLERGWRACAAQRDEVPRGAPRRPPRRRVVRGRRGPSGCGDVRGRPAWSPRRRRPTSRGASRRWPCAWSGTRDGDELARERLDAHPKSRATSVTPGLGGLISFVVGDEDEARRVETSTRQIVNATSLGGTRSKIESRYRWEGERCPPGLLRLSVGPRGSGRSLGDLRAGARAVRR